MANENAINDVNTMKQDDIRLVYLTFNNLFKCYKGDNSKI